MIRKFFFLATIFLLVETSSYSQCPNGDLEMGNLNNWYGYTGYNNGTPSGTLNLSNFIPGFVSGRHTIVGPGFDPILGGNILPQVAEGSRALRLGNSSANKEAEIASYTFVVPANFSFQYALVLNAPNHPLKENPFFRYWISRTNILSASTQPNNLIMQKDIVADIENPFFKTATTQLGDVVYKEWQTECVSRLRDFVGKTVTIFFATADCYWGQHFGYAYIDGLCKLNIPVINLSGPQYVCSVNDLLVIGSSKNYNDHFWKMQKLNSNNINDIVPGTDIQQTFINTPVPSSFNIGAMYMNGGGEITNGYYRVTLGVRNCNGRWAEKSVVVQVDLPEIITSNGYACCSSGASSVSMQASVMFSGGGIFEWYDANGNFIGNGTNTTSGNVITNNISIPNITSYKKLRVRFVGNGGCVNEEWVYAVLIPDFNRVSPGVSCLGFNACGPRELYVFWHPDRCNGVIVRDEYFDLFREVISYSWSTGATTTRIPYDPNIQNYSVTFSTACTTITKSIFVPQYPFPGSFPPLWYSTGVVYQTGNFKIYDNTLPANGGGIAYNAYHYRLRIYNTWGQLVYDSGDQYACDGFYNGEIYWNQIGNQGAFDGVQLPGNTTYSFYLQLQNCDNDDFSSGNTSLQGNFTIVQ